MADSGAVSGLLWDEWVPEQVKRVIASSLPAGLSDARLLSVWLATVHDIGKTTPAFACQVDSLAEDMRLRGLEMDSHKQIPDRKLAPHGLAGQILLQEWLIERFGWSKTHALQFAVVIGGHHGVHPTNFDIKEASVRPELLRTEGYEREWSSVQHELLEYCADLSGVRDRLPAWSGVKLSQTAQVLLTGLVIVADWIASNADLFPYFPEAEAGEERVEAAWRGLSLPGPWMPEQTPEEPADLFAARFDLPPGATVRPVQEQAVRMAHELGAGLLVIEAPMGEGKTEAALAVAEVFAARTGAGGCLVALPTMATGNALFPRMLHWLRRFQGEQHSVFLAHSKAALNGEYQELMRAARRSLSCIDIDGDLDDWSHRGDRYRPSAELVAHYWMRGRKKGLLASFVVGTIDQLLFAGLKSRHLALRHLAVAGKVVVIDEAHAYDTYMNSYLDKVLSWLGAYGVPVVVLSATLPAGRRRELAEAYAGEGNGALAEVQAATGYPLLTMVSRDGVVTARSVEPSGRSTSVAVEPFGDGLDVLADRLAAELAEGGCALVIRNTVGRVLEAAAALRDRFGTDNVTVAHAQFIDLDRAAKDADLLARFGPPEKAADRRPKSAHIVVASQVAEQSLDIDFDLLVTDLCPIDLLLQRMGRLHRHPRGRDRPARLRDARCLVTGADWNAVPVEPVAGSQRVYRRYALLRAAAVLGPYLSGEVNRLRLPDDIAPLVNQAYGGDPVGPADWQEALAKAHADDLRHRGDQRDKAAAFQLNGVGKPGRAVVGWVDAGTGDADDSRAGRAQVRDTGESLEVLVVQRLADGTLRTLPWLADGKGGRTLPTDSAPDRHLAQIVSACGLRLPFVFSIPAVLDAAVAELEAECIPAWQNKECHWLAGELILMLDENCQTRLAGYELTYSQTEGLAVIREQ
jgi:CRISPR-associated helicase Cas3/CRISPR-associated endonuclease Cas3-HD